MLNTLDQLKQIYLLVIQQRAKEKLGWTPETSLEDLVKEMMESDLKLFEKDKYLKEGGHQTLNYYE